MAKIDDSVKKKDPELRFKGFTDEWEERKLKDIAQFNPKTVLPDEFEYVDLESVVGTEMISHRTESKDQAPSRAQRLAQKGDVFYQTVRPYQMNNYLYDLPYDNYVFSTGYAQMRPNIDSYFLLNSVQNKQFVQHVLDRSTGTSYPAINSSDLSNIEIHVPSKLSEQQKIGSFFKQLDDTIALHQRKLDLLKEQKKGYLQKMFPKNGAKVPELRFAGFADDWEERKLGEVGKTKSGIGFPDAQQGGKQGTPFYKVSDMNNPGNEVVMMNANNYASDSQLKENKWNPINPQNSGVVFAKVGAAIFLDRKRIVDTSFLIDNNMMSYLFDSSWNRYFGKTLFEKLRLSRFAQVGALPSFNGSDVEDIKVMIPEESEQKMIGDMFEKLDDIIALHQRKLDLLKEQKKGFLQKMFV